MEMHATRTIAAQRETVWAALNDPEVLKACIPGCEELTGSPEDGFEAVVKQKVGPVKATFKGAVTLSDVVPGVSYTISGEGKGGVAGFAKGSAQVALADAEGGGTVAQLGSRLVDSFATKMADQFFERFQTRLEGPADGDAAPEA